MLLILFSPHTLRPSALDLPERRLCITALSLLAGLPARLFLCMAGGEIAKMECLGRNLFVWNKKERDGCFWPESSGGGRWKTALVCHIGGQGGQDVEWLGAAGSLGWDHGTGPGRSSGLQGRSPRPACLFPHCLIWISHPVGFYGNKRFPGVREHASTLPVH